MIWQIIFGVFIFIMVVSMILFICEIKNAPSVLETEPFLRGDYVPSGEEHFKHVNAFCKNCKFFDGTAMCLHENHFGLIDEHKTKICKEDSLFKPN